MQTSTFDKAYKPGLQHMSDFNEELGDPVSSFRTVHVAGTNGKGSVANMLASVLAGAGLKVGLYTSPHIEDFRERMRIIDGRSGVAAAAELVSREYVLDFLQSRSEAFDRLELSFFEITTGMAFRWFADSAVDMAVIEVGLGGRLDSTNIIRPELSIVTSIGLDHCDLLGDTLAAIAAEKAGIFKDGVPAVVGETLPETEPVFRRCYGADARGLVFADREVPSLWDRREEILSEMDLQGSYQRPNLRTVLVSTDVLRERWQSSCDDVFRAAAEALGDPDRVAESVIHTAERMDFHGRWEKLSAHPYVLCDIGHNAAALRYNYAQLSEMLASGKYTSLTIVYGVMADKNLDDILPLLPQDAALVFTTPETARALPAEDIMCRYKAFCERSGRPVGRACAAGPVRDAVACALKIAETDGGGKPLVYIGGSTFVVSEAVKCF